MVAMGGGSHPLFFQIFNIFFLILLFFNSFLKVDTWQSVSFWTEKLTEVLIRSFLKTEVSSVMQIEIQGLKNKVSKNQGLKKCLTLFFFFFNQKQRKRHPNVTPNRNKRREKKKKKKERGKVYWQPDRRLEQSLLQP
jgi:hypothetical protein